MLRGSKAKRDVTCFKKHHAIWREKIKTLPNWRRKCPHCGRRIINHHTMCDSCYNKRKKENLL